MIPDDSIPSRRLTRRECRLHALMADLAADRRVDEAAACRRDLWRLSAIRSGLATVEHAAVSRKCVSSMCMPGSTARNFIEQ